MHDLISNPTSLLPLQSADGHRYELRWHAAEQPLAAMLFLPAMGVSARQYDGFGAALAQAGVSLAVHEYRGAGSSSLRASRNCNWGYRELLDQDVSASISAIKDLDDRSSWIMAGHSLGAQLAVLTAARNPQRFAGALIHASGAPYWRSFPILQAPLLWGVLSGFDVLSRVVGHYPGRRLGFAGNEARGVIADWAHSGRHGRYSPPSMGADLDASLSRLVKPVLALRLSQDNYVPKGSLDFLLSKLDRAEVRTQTVHSSAFKRGRADHFHWMREPAPVVEAIQGWLVELRLGSRHREPRSN